MDGVSYTLRIYASREAMKASDLATMPYGETHTVPAHGVFANTLLNLTPIEITHDSMSCRETLVRVLQQSHVYSHILREIGYSIYIQIICKGEDDYYFADWLKNETKPDDPRLFYLRYGFLENTDVCDFRVIGDNASITYRVRNGNWISLSALLLTIRMWRHVEKYVKLSDSQWMLKFSEDCISGKIELTDMYNGEDELLITASVFSATSNTGGFVNPFYVGFAVDGPRSYIMYLANFYFWNEMISNVFHHDYPHTLGYLRKLSSSLDKWISQRNWQ